MAVDSATKRASATYLLVPGFAIGVVPSGTVARQASAWCYQGITAGEAATGKRQWRRTVRKVAGMRGIR